MSLDPEGARALLRRPDVARLLDLLDRDGEETRIVGGAVRNALLGRPVHEVDLATTAHPDETMRRARRGGLRAVPTGIAHGTVTVILAGTAFEVTTLRRDVETDGRRAVVRFGRDFTEDAERRDFTINGLTLDRAGTLHDSIGGLADLAARRVRFIGDPLARIREDYLRILRFFRFHAEYAEGPLDRPALEAAILCREGLALLSRERVRAELLKLVAARSAPETLSAFGATGLLGRLVAELADAGRLGRAAAAAQDPVGRLAAAFVRTVEDAGRLRAELRLSNAEAARLAAYAGALARLVSRPEPVDAREIRRTVVLHGLEAARDALAAVDGEARPVVTDAARRLLRSYAAGEAALPRFGLTGADLVRDGLPPGPEVGRRLAAARAAWIAAGCPDGPFEVPG